MVLSSARYPGGEHGHYQDMFTWDNVTHHMSPSMEKHKISEKIQEFHVKNMQSKLQLYSFSSRPVECEEESVGLGRLPGGVRCASSLTVYNTAVCPYTSHTSHTTILQPASQGKRTSEPPQTLTDQTEDVSALQADSQDQAGQTGLLYFPEMGDLPDFDLPDDLELPNIATDLQVGLAAEFVLE